MINNFFDVGINIIIIGLVFYSIIFHEISHGLVAYWLGDDTAKRKGRITLNPLAHIDWFGTVILPIILYFTAGFIFGYAKPVPINPYNFQNYKRDTGLTALAGPLTNILIAILFAVGFHIFKNIRLITFISIHIVQINLFLALFNLIPFPPLDGSKVLGMFLSEEAYYRYTMQERLGMIIFLALLLLSNIFHLNIFGRIIIPVLSFMMQLLGIPM